jgi:Flp pilus assembly protein TadG
MNARRGQVLPLFAIFLIGLFAAAALAVDVSSAYSARQAYRTAADAASLAGAQDLQGLGTRAVSSADRTNARADALTSLMKAFAATTTTGTCAPAAHIGPCQLDGTPFVVTIDTPSPTCVTCDSTHSVQVTVSNPRFGLTFARILGFGQFNVAVTAVAGLNFGRSYAIQTLRPPKRAGATFLVNDIEIDGGSVVNVQHGDVGSNANMDYAGGGSILNIDPGYGMFYFDPLSGPGWFGPPAPPAQIVQKLPTLITDPGYQYPAMRGILGSANCSSGPNNCAPTFDDNRTSSCGAPSPTAACTSAALDPSVCGVEATYLSTSVYTFMATQPATSTYCYKPGIYDPSNSSRGLSIGPSEVVILLPGAYYFKSPNGGIQVNGRLVGGYRPSTPGVALMFDECLNTCVLNGNNALTIALNAGTKFPPGTAGTSATAAHDWNDDLVQTSGPASPTPPLLMTLLVTKDSSCFVPTSPPFIEPTGCDPGTHDKTLNMAGGGSLALEGVQYAPTDNIEIHGGSVGTGQVGQIIAWTLFYSGGTHINQEGPPVEGPGTLRLDAACTIPGVACNP